MVKCDWCGQFISYKDKDAMTYTNYGGYSDLEPPESTDICGKCWNKLSDESKEYYKNSKWIRRPATKLFRREVKNGSTN